MKPYSPEVISPTNKWYDPVQQYVHKDGAVGVNSGYNVEYDIKTVTHYILTGTIHSKIVTRKFTGPGPQ